MKYLDVLYQETRCFFWWKTRISYSKIVEAIVEVARNIRGIKVGFWTSGKATAMKDLKVLQDIQLKRSSIFLNLCDTFRALWTPNITRKETRSFLVPTKLNFPWFLCKFFKALSSCNFLRISYYSCTFELTPVKSMLHMLVFLFDCFGIFTCGLTQFVEKKKYQCTWLDTTRDDRCFYKQQTSSARLSSTVRHDYTSRSPRRGSAQPEFCFISCGELCFHKYQWVQLGSAQLTKWILLPLINDELADSR